MSDNPTKNCAVGHNGCNSASTSMEMTLDDDGPMPSMSGVVNGHANDEGSSVAGSTTRILSQTDRDVVRLIAQHLQNLGLKWV